MHDLQISLIVLILCVSTAFVILHSYKNKESFALNAMVTFFAAISIFVFTNFGTLHKVVKSDPEFVKETGSPIKSSYFHWHEIYHYYLGSKYYKELGHYGLYETVAYADSISDNKQLTVDRVRFLTNPNINITIDEALERGENIYRPNFSDERWAEFEKDLAYMKSIAMNNWLDYGMYDVGFNPPPTWSVIGHTISNLIPLSEPWFDYPVTWDQAEIIPLLDVLLLLVACFFVYRSFGYLAMLMLVLGFCTSWVSSSHWVVGSFFRHIWLFSLIMGMCMLKEKKYYAAGIFFCMSACMRVFPAIFAIGAAIAMLLRWYLGKKEYFKHLLKFAYGGITVLVILVPLSFMMFGLDLWKEFIENITVHKDINFVGHLGYKKVVAWGPWTTNQNFHWDDGMARFISWNERMDSAWKESFPYNFPFIMIVIGAALIAMTKISIAESALLFGGIYIFFFETPANYYYSYLAVVPVVAYGFREKNNLKDLVIAASFFLLWGSFYQVPNFTGDTIAHAHYFSVLLLLFFLFWTFYRLIDLKTIQALRSQTPAKKTKK